ncbi:MAG: nucleotidyl transferase AbiEii/AbiGii toxin family protein [Chloroflexi bacterium]|nr:nucleotidyl transferase AbiEii/AbiGii toxin family protein [Chloroflexota bacterium]
MRYASASAFRQALEARLVALSSSRGSSLVRLRKEVAFDRLLTRLFVAAPGRWILKGGLAFDYRFGTRARSTKDMDLVGAPGEEAATSDLLAAADVDMDDYFSFSIERTAKLDQLLEGAAVRYHVRADLGGRRFEDFVVDIGFDIPSDWEPEVLIGPDLLSFAEIEPVAAPSLPLELQVAEKVHAYTRGYGKQPVGSTRVKDIVDLALVASTADLDAARLGRAIRETFQRRSDHDLPQTLPPPPGDWEVPFRRLAGEIELMADLDSGHELAARLLDPILSGNVTAGRWDAAGQVWLAD